MKNASARDRGDSTPPSSSAGAATRVDDEESRASRRGREAGSVEHPDERGRQTRGAVHDHDTGPTERAARAAVTPSRRRAARVASAELRVLAAPSAVPGRIGKAGAAYALRVRRIRAVAYG